MKYDVDRPHARTCLCWWCTGDSEAGDVVYADEVQDSGEPQAESQLVDYVCDYVLGAIRGITDAVKEKSMLPSHDSDGSSSSNNRRRKGGMEYLTNEMLSTSPKEAKILACKYDGDNKYGARVVYKLAFEGKTLFWGVNIKKNPNYQLLIHEFGRDENDHIGKKIMLYLEQDNFSEQYFARVDFPAKQETKRK